MADSREEFHCEVLLDNSNAVDLLSVKTGFSKQKIKLAMKKGAVWLTDARGTQRIRRHSKKLVVGNTLHFYFDSRIFNEEVADAKLICDETEYSVWYKPRGMVSQGSKWGDYNAINRWVERRLKPQRPAFIVHRLDRFASGLILIAHTKKMATMLSALFQQKQINKQYKALVQGSFPPEKITFRDAVEGKHAVTHASLLKYEQKSNTSLVQLDIETGRKHQIRYHLSKAGFPIIGDRLFSAKDSKSDLQLTAYKLSFVSPIDCKEKEYLLEKRYQPCLDNIENLQ